MSAVPIDSLKYISYFFLKGRILVSLILSSPLIFTDLSRILGQKKEFYYLITLYSFREVTSETWTIQ